MPFDIYVPGKYGASVEMMPTGIGVRGRFNVGVITTAGRECPVRKCKVDNLITDPGLDAWFEEPPGGVSGAWVPFSRYFAGTGNAGESTSDSQLDNFAFGVGPVPGSLTRVAPSSPDWVLEWQFGQATSDAVGAPINIAEIGIGGLAKFSGADPGEAARHRINSRALIRDNNNNATTISLLAGEKLRVSYSMFQHRDLSDKTFSINISGQSYTVTSRPFSLDAPYAYVYPQRVITGARYSRIRHKESDSLLALNSSSGTSQSTIPSTGEYDPYTPGSHTTDYRIIIPPEYANYGGGLGWISNAHSLAESSNVVPWTQFSFDPPIPKTNQFRLELNCRTVISRYTP